MTTSRWSIRNVMRQVKGALGSAARADVRYAKDFEIATRIRLAMRSLREAQKQLGFAMRDARSRRGRVERRRAA